MKKQFAFIFLFIVGLSCFAQNAKASSPKADTLYLDSLPVHSPKKATLLSLAVPGLGQAYNKKYWKIPLVYAIIGTPLLFALQEGRLYDEFKDAYISEQLGEPHKYTDVYNGTQLNALLEGHRQNRDLFTVLTVAAYAMNILDAAVDAHLYNFDVSDDLSASLKPSFQYDRMSSAMIPSMTLSLKFGKKSQRNAF
ncbi:DUF5683 domain-containing protein [Vicingaceae bacterium]|nr:DUF5683 domain-containing protein [Vicingaceae bacterium]